MREQDYASDKMENELEMRKANKTKSEGVLEESRPNANDEQLRTRTRSVVGKAKGQ